MNRYASEVDIDFVRKAVRSIGRLAIKVEPAADDCIKTLLGLIETKVSYVVPEAIIVIKDIFRRYPGKYEGIIPTLCEHLDALDEPEAKAAMIWIVGQFADKIENADELLEDLLYTFKEDPVEVRKLPVCAEFETLRFFKGATCTANSCGEALHLQVSIGHNERAGSQSSKMGNRRS